MVEIINQFKLNENITLRLEQQEGNSKKKTVIYVNEEPFRHCKFLLLTLLKGNTVEDFKERIHKTIQDTYETSIDHQAEKLDKSLHGPEAGVYEPEMIQISEEEEFKAHCSNLQAWVESGYDSRFLHHSLGFPLLKKLTEVGDPLASRKFKEEIAKRFREGTDATRNYLIMEQYLGDFLTEEEFWAIVPEESIILKEIIEELNCKWMIGESNADYIYNKKKGENQLGFAVGNDYYIKTLCFYRLGISQQKWNWLFDQLRKFPRLENLFILESNLTQVPASLASITSLKYLKFNRNRISSLPEGLEAMEKLETLRLDQNRITHLPKSFYQLNVELLDLKNNELTSISKRIEKMRDLVVLHLNNNELVNIPVTILNLDNLEYISIRGNKIPDSNPTIQSLKNNNVMVR